MWWGRQIKVVYIEEIVVCPVEGVERGSNRNNDI
jgi:hypothetical protein